MSISIKELDIEYCKDMAELLNSDHKLHLALSPNKPLKNITGKEYYETCKLWEQRKNGRNHIVFYSDKPIGSISYCNKNKYLAGCGY